METLFLAWGLVALFTLLLMGLAAWLLRRRRVAAGLSLLTPAVLLFLAATAGGLLLYSVRSYTFFNREEVAATIQVIPKGEQRFTALFTYPDGRRERFELAGDQILVDAQILKWKPAVNFLGLHTAYELDRVSGRYVSLDDETDRARTVHELSDDRPLDLFALRRRWSFLEPLVDAEYGSGTFVPADAPRTIEVRVSTSGLLIRETGS